MDDPTRRCENDTGICVRLSEAKDLQALKFYD